MDVSNNVEASTSKGNLAEAGSAASMAPHQSQENSKAEPTEEKQGPPDSQQSESMEEKEGPPESQQSESMEKKDSTAESMKEKLSAEPTEEKEELVVPSQQEMLAPLSTSKEASQDKATRTDETTGTPEATDPVDPLEPRQLQQKFETDSTGKGGQLEKSFGHGEKLETTSSKGEVLFPTRSPPADLFVADDDSGSPVRMQRHLRSPLSASDSIDVSNVTLHRSPQDSADNEQEVHARKRDDSKRRLRGANTNIGYSAKDLHSRDLFQLAVH